MLALVILNYKTYIDSYNLLKSISDNFLNNEVTVFLVDNDSDFHEFSNLKDLVKNFSIDIYFLPQDFNLGFSRGMNVGIDKARELGFDFIICSNNDVIIPAGFTFERLVAPYYDDNTIAMIGPQIMNLDSVTQNPLYTADPFRGEINRKIIKSIFLLPFFGRALFMFRGLFKHFFSQIHLKSNSKNIDAGRVYSLHGSFFMLTPAYFLHYKNLDSNTFLYYEELILSKRIECAGLTCYLNALSIVIHKEDSSTNAVFGQGTFRKTIFILNENYRSLAYYLKNYI